MTDIQRFPCVQCGAVLEFAAGSHALKCPYCGAQQGIAPPIREIEERDLLATLANHAPPAMEPDNVVHCNSCAAEFVLPPHIESSSCPFCGSNVVVPAKPESRILPDGVMPFVVDERGMRERYKQWIGSRFWAPNNLKSRALQKNEVKGIYVPYWTYDAFTTTAYTGQRGEDYIEQESYTDSQGNRQTRSVTKTRWYPASGTVQVPFDDVLVLGSTHVPTKYADAMNTWQLQHCVSYEPAYLSGFSAMRYDVDLTEGFEAAKRKMVPPIEQAIRYDIGGDRQMISWMETEYSNLTFKHLLLPIWSGAYRYNNRIWNFLVNGQTGEVRGEAPVSPWKVAIAVILGLIIIGTFLYLMDKSG
jgi:DNA-directed RNA polymerase subunit RPC12/RpoP